MFYHSIARRKPLAQFSRFVIERPHAAAIRNVPALINHVEPLRPSRVCRIGGVAHVIDPEWKIELEPLREIVGDSQALLQRFRLRIADIILQVRFHLPFVGGMRFTNIDG